MSTSVVALINLVGFTSPVTSRSAEDQNSPAQSYSLPYFLSQN